MYGFLLLLISLVTWNIRYTLLVLSMIKLLVIFFTITGTEIYRHLSSNSSLNVGRFYCLDLCDLQYFEHCSDSNSLSLLNLVELGTTNN